MMFHSVKGFMKDAWSEYVKYCGECYSYMYDRH